MKIGFDARYIRWDHHDGISRFSTGLAHALAPLATSRGHQVTFIISDDRQRAFLPTSDCVMVSGPTSAHEPHVAKQLRTSGFDVVFSPMQTMGSRGRTYRLVLTVHDLIYYRHRTPPPQFTWALRLLWRLYHLSWAPQRFLLNRADAIVSVSQTTAALIAQHRLTTKPVFVVPNAVDPVSPRSRDVSVAKRAKRILYMGSFMPYKNVETLVAATAHLPDWEIHLLSRVDDHTRARLTKVGAGARIVFHNGTTDTDYHSLLGTSRVLVSASRDEGFGIPLIEAMAHGTPVVVSDIPIFHEVCGDAAQFVQPDDVSGFARAIGALSSDAVWSDASQRAVQRSQDFSWVHSARDLLNVLERTGNAETT